MSCSRERHLLYIGFCVALLPVIFLRDFTPANELRYLSIADEALRNHSLFTFSSHGLMYADKPPLYLWIVMLCRWLTGGHYMWLLSLFSLLPAIGMIKALDDWVKDEMDGRSRNLAMLMTMSSGLFLVCAVTIRMDMLMCLFIVLALREFWRGRSQWLFPLYIFLAVFTKGPLGFLIPFVSTTVFLAITGRIRHFFHYWDWRTWSVLLILCGAWFGAVYLEGGTDYLHNLLFHQTIGRAFNAFHHSHPFYYYAIHIWYCLAPWSLLVIGVFIASLRSKVVKSDLQRFFLTIAVTTFILLSCISSKLQIYLLPAMPFVVYSAAMFLPRYSIESKEGGVESKEKSLLKMSIAIPSLIFVLALPAINLFASSNGLGYLDNGMVYAGATIFTFTGIRTLYFLYSKNKGDAVKALRGLGLGFLLAVFTTAWAFPKMNDYIGYGNLCKETLAISHQTGIKDIRAWRLHHSQNMDVYLQRPLPSIPKTEVPAASTTRPFILLTERGERSRFRHYKVFCRGNYAIVVITDD